MFSWKWIQPQSTDPSFDPPAAAGHSFDLPDEIWALIFHEACLRERDLYSLSLSCRHFNTLALPVLLYDFTDTSPSSLAAGKITMNSNLVPALTMAIQLPFIQRLSLTFDIHGDSKAPGELLALRTLVGRLPSLVDLWLNFPRDLLSAYKSDLTPLTPQRAMTESFCDLLSAIPSTPNDPVVFVGTEVFTSRAEDIRGWQLDKYMFTEPPTGTGGGRLLSLLSYIRPQAVKNPLRTKTSVKQHNGLYASAFPFISISSVHIQRLSGPFSADISGGGNAAERPRASPRRVPRPAPHALAHVLLPRPPHSASASSTSTRLGSHAIPIRVPAAHAQHHHHSARRPPPLPRARARLPEPLH
ncbi:hypothetical protein C8R46DRAFT_1075488, partial [Mycena filopes]